jgi:hypothetical protein
MPHGTPHRVTAQLESLRASFAQTSGLPCASLLAVADVQAALPPDAADEPIYTPLVTLALFLSQVCAADPSCRQAVARLLAQRALRGEPACAAGTGAYCKARLRWPEAALHQLVQRTGRALHQQALPAWHWHGRRVPIVDGTTVTMPDTPANQATYPQPDGQQPGRGFPMARLGVLLCLATGAVRDVAIAPYRGKGTGELSLLRQLWHHLGPGDVVLGDRIYCSYFEIALLQQRGIDVVLHKHQSRHTDFRTGQRLGRDDHVVVWRKPSRPDWLDAATYAALPATLAVREVAVGVPQRGRGRRRLVLVTTLRDPQALGREALGELYRQRWQAELDLRSMKAALRMGELRCQTPAMVRKEIWLHLLAYNLLRGLLAQAAAREQVQPRRLSFTGALPTLQAFRSAWQALAAGPEPAWYDRLWVALASHRVGNRPGRVEPRAKKRRQKNYPVLTEPRKTARKKLLKRAA